jgi:hypothetical protein
MGGHGMTIAFTAPWHKASFDHFQREALPQLLADHLPLVDYQINETGQYSIRK